MASLTALPWASPAAGQACTPESPLHVAVLVDHSSSVFDNEPAFGRTILGWLSNALDLLRPGDLLGIYELPTGEHGGLAPLVELPVPEIGTAADERNGSELLERARRLATRTDRRDELSDVTEGLRQIVQRFREEREPACSRIVVLLTDGSIAPRGSMSRETAQRELEDASRDLRGSGARLVVLRAGRPNAEAFDPEKAWLPTPRTTLQPVVSAADLLSRITEDKRSPPYWLAPGALADQLFGPGPFWKARGFSNTVGSVPTEYPAYTRQSYVFYRGLPSSGRAPTDSLLSCTSTPGVRQEIRGDVRHVISRFGSRDPVCYHHLSGPIDTLLRRLTASGLRSFALGVLEQHLWVDAVPDPLHSFARIVVSDSGPGRCAWPELHDVHSGRAFIPRRSESDLIWVWYRFSSSNHDDSLKLQRIEGTPCWAPAGLPEIRAGARGGQSLDLFMRRTLPNLGSAVVHRDAELLDYRWHRLRRVGSAWYLRFLGEAWLFDGLIELPADAPSVLFDNQEPVGLTEAKGRCGPVAQGHHCFRLHRVVSGEVPPGGWIALSGGERIERAEPDVYFATPGSLASYGMLTPLWQSLGILLVLGMIAVACRWWRERHSGAVVRERVICSPATYTWLGWFLAAGVLLLLLSELVRWSTLPGGHLAAGAESVLQIAVDIFLTERLWALTSKRAGGVTSWMFGLVRGTGTGEPMDQIAPHAIRVRGAADKVKA
ncbi:MAG TPA: vWA domain-containing protein [Longimicrobiaceae bacterium]|nr:vWA domain-containing protein [Longimicrobiaceae bacterium]